MKYLFNFLAVMLLLIVNIGFFGNFSIYGQIPNLLFLFALNFALDKTSFDYIFVSFICGLILDFYSTSFFGSYTIAFLLTSVLCNLVIQNFIFLELNWKYFSLILFIGLSVLNFCLWLYGFMVFKFNWHYNYIQFNTYLNNFYIMYGYNWLLFYPIYLFYNKLQDLIKNFLLKGRGVVL